MATVLLQTWDIILFFYLFFFLSANKLTSKSKCMYAVEIVSRGATQQKSFRTILQNKQQSWCYSCPAVLWWHLWDLGAPDECRSLSVRQAWCFQWEREASGSFPGVVIWLNASQIIIPIWSKHHHLKSALISNQIIRYCAFKWLLMTCHWNITGLSENPEEKWAMKKNNEMLLWVLHRAFQK